MEKSFLRIALPYFVNVTLVIYFLYFVWVALRFLIFGFSLKIYLSLIGGALAIYWVDKYEQKLNSEYYE